MAKRKFKEALKPYDIKVGSNSSTEYYSHFIAYDRDLEMQRLGIYSAFFTKPTTSPPEMVLIVIRRVISYSNANYNFCNEEFYELQMLNVPIFTSGNETSFIRSDNKSQFC